MKSTSISSNQTVFLWLEVMFCCCTSTIAKISIDIEEMPINTELEAKHTEEMQASRESEIKDVKGMPTSSVFRMQNPKDMPDSTELEMQNHQEMPGSTEFVTKSIDKMSVSAVLEIKDAEEMQGIHVIEMQNTQEIPGSTEFVIKSIDEMPASTVLEMQGSDVTEVQNTEEMQGNTEVHIPNAEDIAASTAFAMEMMEDMSERSPEIEVKNPVEMLASSAFEIKTTDITLGNCELEMEIEGEEEDFSVRKAAFELDNAQLELPPGTVIFSPNRRMKAPSRYLRSSLSSCHDLCKYEIQYFTGAKGGSSIKKTISTLGQDQDVETTTTPTRGTRQKGTSHKPSLTAAKNKFTSCILRKDVLVYASSGSSSRSTNIGGGKELQPLKIGQREMSRPPFSLSPRICAIKKTESTDIDKHKNLKRASRLRDGKNAVKTETEQENCEEIEEKIIRVVEPEADKKHDGSTLTQNGGNATGLLPSMEDRVDRMPNCSPNRPRAKASLSHQSRNLRKARNATPKSRLAPTLSFPENRNSRRSSHFVRSSSALSPSSTITEENCSNRDSNESATSKQSKTLKQEQKSTNSPKKSSYRKGMSSNLQAENNNARRLQFRQTKPASESSNGKDEIRRRRFARKETGSEAKGPDIKSEKVVLKHQDVKEKTDEKDYNNVIKETASKLVESRKSKVKALVGAFETVISLQELKPSRSSI